MSESKGAGAPATLSAPTGIQEGSADRPGGPQPSSGDPAGNESEGAAGPRGEATASAEAAPRAQAGPAPRTPGGIKITAPGDGHTVSADDPPVVIVEGEVEDRDISSIWLVAGGHRTSVRVREGRFKHAVPVLEATTRLWAEVTAGGEPVRSGAITVRNTAPGPVTVLAMEAPATGDGAIQMTASWRPRSDRLDGVVPDISVKSFDAGSDLELSTFLYLRHTRSGVYNFVARHRAAGPVTIGRARLYHLVNGRMEVRDLGPVSVGGGTSATVSRMLLPQGVVWEQDEWFTGRSEGAETVTKFRFPEGIGWIERKIDLR